MGPSDWKLQRLEDLITKFDAGVSVNSDDRPAGEGEFGVLKVSAVTEGIFRPGENKFITGTERTRACVNPKRDRLIMSRANTPELVGATAYIDRDYPNIFLSDKLWQFEPRSDGKISMRWLGQVLASPAYRKRLGEIATGSSQSMKNISQDAVMRLELPVPPLEEQHWLASTLGLWDVAIDKTERLIAAKVQNNDSLTTRLYVLSDRKGQRTRFSELLKESMVSGTSGLHAKKITVKLYGKGVLAKVNQRQGSAKTQYFVRRAGQLIFSKLDFLNGAFGIIPPEIDGYESTLDLPAFDISASVNAVWLLGYLTRPAYYTQQVGLARGQRKARRVHPSDLLASTLHVPPYALQNLFAEMLAASRRDINSTKCLLELLKIQKRGLMQKLLSGQWQVKSPETEAA